MITTETRAGISIVRLDRPERLNALVPEMIAALIDKLRAAAAQAERPIALTGTGSAFCSGADVKWLASLPDPSLGVADLVAVHHLAITSILELRVPLIAAVNGVVAGGGIGLVLACDYSVVAEQASFTAAYPRLGLTPDGGASAFLERTIGLTRTRELLLTNRRLSAQEAREWGLVNEVVPDDQVLERAAALADELPRVPGYRPAGCSTRAISAISCSSSRSRSARQPRATSSAKLFAVSARPDCVESAMVGRPFGPAKVVIQRVVLLAVTALALSLVFGAASPTPTLALTPTGTPTPPPTTVPSATPTSPTTTGGVTPTATTTATLTPWPTAAFTFTPTATVVPTATAVPTPKPPSQLPATLPGLSRDEGTFLVTAGDNGGRADYFIAGNQRHSILVADEQLELQINPLWPVRGATRDEVLTYPEGAPVGSARTGLLTAPTVVARELVADAPVADVPAPAATVASAPDALTADVPAAAAIADVPTPSDATATYTLRRGDNLTELAATYATSIEAILAANGISNPNRIYVGQTLTIPSGAPTSTLAEPAPVADAPTATEPVADVQPASDASYTVQRGDSAIGIARRFGIDEAALLEANQIANPNRVYVGQVLTIPAAND